MMATGIRDPVREAAIETWDVTLPTLTIDGSNPDDADPDQVATYCGTSTYGTDCTTYYDTAVISGTFRGNTGETRGHSRKCEEIRGTSGKSSVGKKTVKYLVRPTLPITSLCLNR